MEEKKKEQAVVISQEQLADGIYSMWLSLIHISEPTRPY